MKRLGKIGLGVLVFFGSSNGFGQENVAVDMSESTLTCAGNVLQLDVSSVAISSAGFKHSIVHARMPSEKNCSLVRSEILRELGPKADLPLVIQITQGRDYDTNARNYRGTGRRIYYDVDVLRNVYELVKVAVLDFDLRETARSRDCFKGRNLRSQSRSLKRKWLHCTPYLFS